MGVKSVDDIRIGESIGRSYRIASDSTIGDEFSCTYELINALDVVVLSGVGVRSADLTTWDIFIGATDTAGLTAGSYTLRVTENTTTDYVSDIAVEQLEII